MGKATTLTLDGLDHAEGTLDKKESNAAIEELQDHLVKLQRSIFQEGRRAILVFEGCDAAGKGGAIRRVTEPLDPRGVTVHPIGAPRPDEQGRHYLYRFWRRLPRPGHIAIFDRSWYGRVLVERVEGLVPPAAIERAYDEINEFERTLLDDGVLFVKIYLHITKDEQLERFAKRIEDPNKRWKITEDDVRNRAKWEAYGEAANVMFARTSTERAPWRLISGNHKTTARLEVLRTVVDTLEASVELVPPAADLARLTEIVKQLGLARLLPLKP